MESNQYGEHKRRAVLYRGVKSDPVINTDAMSPFFNYGRGFFETILYEKGKLHFFREHQRRIENTCRDFQIHLNFSEIGETKILNYLEETGLKDHCCRVKILYAPVKEANRWDTVVTASPYTRPVKDFTLSLHNEVYDSKLNRYKSLNYEYNLYWKNYYFKKENSDEVLFCNREGNILEGSFTNILFVKDSILYYVDRNNNYLPGIMQDRVLLAASESGLKIVALPIGIPQNRLKDADEVIICNSLMQLAHVRKIITEDKNRNWVYSRMNESLIGKTTKSISPDIKN